MRIVYGTCICTICIVHSYVPTGVFNMLSAHRQACSSEEEKYRRKIILFDVHVQCSLLMFIFNLSFMCSMFIFPAGLMTSINKRKFYRKNKRKKSNEKYSSLRSLFIYYHKKKTSRKFDCFIYVLGQRDWRLRQRWATDRQKTQAKNENVILSPVRLQKYLTVIHFISCYLLAERKLTWPIQSQ